MQSGKVMQEKRVYLVNTQPVSVAVLSLKGDLTSGRSGKHKYAQKELRGVVPATLFAQVYGV
jgi:hypothetical protein